MNLCLCVLCAYVVSLVRTCVCVCVVARCSLNPRAVLKAIGLTDGVVHLELFYTGVCVCVCVCV